MKQCLCETDHIYIYIYKDTAMGIVEKCMNSERVHNVKLRHIGAYLRDSVIS